MNKKLVAMTTSMLVGGSLLCATAFANASQTSGYETYKAAIKNMQTVKSATGKMELTVIDNGTQTIKVNSDVKMNKDQKAMNMSSSVTVGNEKTDFTVFHQDGKMITKSSKNDVYYERTMDEKGMHKNVDKQQDPQITQGVEGVMDAVVGNMKDYVVATDKGQDGKEISIHLSENQLPPLVNAVTSLMTAVHNQQGQMMEKHNSSKNEVLNVKESLPKLISDVKITKVDVTAEVDKNNVIEEQKATLTLSGKDDKGQVHEVVINANVDLTNINSTTPDKLDLTGKNIQQLQNKARQMK